ncbi:unnamed protein product [Closterium sp. Yama58-4]|nr:unnamed protein product [Closterium sp. Yama58-4]
MAASFERWSEAATWGGGGIPGQGALEGANVTIPCGKAVLLDTSPVLLTLLQIQGVLMFEDTPSLPLLLLNASFILLQGRLAIGAQQQHFSQRAVLTLTPNPSARAPLLVSDPLPADAANPRNLGHKALAVKRLLHQIASFQPKCPLSSLRHPSPFPTLSHDHPTPLYPSTSAPSSPCSVNPSLLPRLPPPASTLLPRSLHPSPSSLPLPPPFPPPSLPPPSPPPPFPPLSPFLPPISPLQLGGRLDLHGMPGGPSTPSWCQLARTAPAGATSLLVDADVSGWPVGGLIAVSSTDYSTDQAEDMSITAASHLLLPSCLCPSPPRSRPSRLPHPLTTTTIPPPLLPLSTLHSLRLPSVTTFPNGTSLLTLSSPLAYSHFGDPLGVPDGFGGYIDERAEVALLSRTVTITSVPESSPYDREGGHVSVYFTQRAQAVEGVEFSGLGQEGQEGRAEACFLSLPALDYPLSFPSLPPCPISPTLLPRSLPSPISSPVSLLHDPPTPSSRRCLVLTAPSRMWVEGNVAYGTSGHCFTLLLPPCTPHPSLLPLLITLPHLPHPPSPVSPSPFPSPASLPPPAPLPPTVQRCLVLTAASGMWVEGNVAYNTLGHCFMLSFQQPPSSSSLSLHSTSLSLPTPRFPVSPTLFPGLPLESQLPPSSYPLLPPRPSPTRPHTALSGADSSERHVGGGQRGVQHARALLHALLPTTTLRFLSLPALLPISLASPNSSLPSSLPYPITPTLLPICLPHSPNPPVHTSMQRCLVLTAASGMWVEGNVAYNTLGHCFMLSSGAETRNTLANNLGFLTRRAGRDVSGMRDTSRPATFLLANPDNDFINNTAAGSYSAG